MFYRLRRVMGPKSERNVLKVKKGHVKVQTERRLQGAENSEGKRSWHEGGLSSSQL